EAVRVFVRAMPRSRAVLPTQFFLLPSNVLQRRVDAWLYFRELAVVRHGAQQLRPHSHWDQSVRAERPSVSQSRCRPAGWTADHASQHLVRLRAGQRRRSWRTLPRSPMTGFSDALISTVQRKRLGWLFLTETCAGK